MPDLPPPPEEVRAGLPPEVQAYIQVLEEQVALLQRQVEQVRGQLMHLVNGSASSIRLEVARHHILHAATAATTISTGSGTATRTTPTYAVLPLLRFVLRKVSDTGSVAGVMCEMLSTVALTPHQTR